MCVSNVKEQKRTLNQEEEAQDPSGGDDESGDDEGHPPLRGHEGSCDEGAQDVSHGGVGVPHAHDEATPEEQNTIHQLVVKHVKDIVQHFGKDAYYSSLSGSEIMINIMSVC